jgi:hypothetical protein
MSAGVILFGLIFLFMAGGLFAFWRSTNQNLPKKMPPPLKDEEEDDEDDWGKRD